MRAVLAAGCPFLPTQVLPFGRAEAWMFPRRRQAAGSKSLCACQVQKVKVHSAEDLLVKLRVF